MEKLSATSGQQNVDKIWQEYISIKSMVEQSLEAMSRDSASIENAANSIKQLKSFASDANSFLPQYLAEKMQFYCQSSFKNFNDRRARLIPRSMFKFNAAANSKKPQLVGVLSNAEDTDDELDVNNENLSKFVVGSNLFTSKATAQTSGITSTNRVRLADFLRSAAPQPAESLLSSQTNQLESTNDYPSDIDHIGSALPPSRENTDRTSKFDKPVLVSDLKKCDINSVTSEFKKSNSNDLNQVKEDNGKNGTAGELETVKNSNQLNSTVGVKNLLNAVLPFKIGENRFTMKCLYYVYKNQLENCTDQSVRLCLTSQSVQNTANNSTSKLVENNSSSQLTESNTTSTTGGMTNISVSLKNLSNCIVFLDGKPNSVYITNVNNCVVVVEQNSLTSIFVNSSKNSLFVLESQQIRISDCSNCDFYCDYSIKDGLIFENTYSCFVSTKMPIRDGSRALVVEETADCLSARPIDKRSEYESLHPINVIDFNWLSKRIPSPNYKHVSYKDSYIGQIAIGPDVNSDHQQFCIFNVIEFKTE